ncbi:hypothetical protein A3SI_17132 [Nitritalea halalkaliphila LW7]|uniref:Uncharacterized protein n=1 Tax=Nitritalea halalkaliphila LW7 TaxID=1189621 RepID=I5BW87_9BACT|nr:DUF4391 domain-containing protein [Nitritalea halalkaliphila]EIM73839.1 hypothetical protein A3SI_17132 [Nitritalea halalkaliphila LW7]
MRLIDYLKWPAASVFSIKMTKKVLKEIQSDVKQDLLDSIEKMTWTGSLKPQHLQIPAFINEEFCYDEVVFIEVELREKAAADRVARLLQKAIPYPLVLGFIYQKEFCFQLAEKTIHQQQKDKRKVNQDKFLFSEWMDAEKLSEQQKNYLTNLSLDKVGGTHLKEYFDKLMNHIHDENRQDQLALLALEKKAITIKNEYARERNAAKKAELHTQARALAEQMKALKSRLNYN